MSRYRPVASEVAALSALWLFVGWIWCVACVVEACRAPCARGCGCTQPAVPLPKRNMRKSLASAVVCGALSLVLAGPVPAQTVVDFESLTGQSAVPAGYGGIDWGPSWFHYGWAQSPYNPSSGTQRVYNNSSSTAFFTFAAPTEIFGAWFAGNYTAMFRLFLDGSLVHTTGSLALSSTPTYLAAGYSGGVDRVEVVATNGQFVMDDVTYGPANTVTPEPITMALLGTGLVGIGAARRRRKRELA